MRKRLTIYLMMIVLTTCLQTWAADKTANDYRHWTVADGLPTGEVQQIVRLPNGQMLVNCEGVFCLSNGARFDVLPCDYGRAFTMEQFQNRYGEMWQGDSLLWLRDLYRIYLFDTRTLSFRYDIAQRLNTPTMRKFIETDYGAALPTPEQQQRIDSLNLGRNTSCATYDHQGGLWIGTRTNGIIYLPPHTVAVSHLTGNNPLTDQARSTIDRQGRIWRCKVNGLECEHDGHIKLYNKVNIANLPYNRTTFIQQLPDGRYLLCDSLQTLGYLSEKIDTFSSLNEKLPQLQAYRHFVGACPISSELTVVYSQNGCFVLNVKADRIEPLPAAGTIARYSTKFNCMVKDRKGQLWVGTQNGLFVITNPLASAEEETRRIEGMKNSCIRSLTIDSLGCLWAGTANGITRITPCVVNMGPEDGIPSMSMMERAACTTAEGMLVFASGASHSLAFHPDSVLFAEQLLPVVITRITVNDAVMSDEQLKALSYDQNYISLQFSTLNYATPSHHQYHYRLLPLEKKWNNSSNTDGQGTATYRALPPGNYLFEAQARTASGEWSPVTTLSLIIRPPLWLTWWAKVLYVMVLIAVTGYVIGYYLRRKKKKLERENDDRVNRLFELRDEARHQFAQSVNIVPGKIAADKQEEVLIEKMLKAIGDHMDDCDYTVDQLASDMAMSRASFYKKMQTMLGITPNEFIRNVKLKHAARLLTETDTPVNQVSLMVGFQTTRYFSQCFKKMFGVNPSEYRGYKKNTEPHIV